MALDRVPPTPPEGPPALMALGQVFFARPTVAVARDLLGRLIVSRGPEGSSRAARIVEVEAYLGVGDAASHARRGPTPRAAIMFGPPGRLYVYLVYGMHHCMNVVTETDGVAGAVLLRAAEPVWGFDLCARAGGPPPARGGAISPGARPLAGPGKLCAGLGITRQHNGLDLERGPVFIADTAPATLATTAVTDRARASVRGRLERIKRSARIGVAYAGASADRPLRFYLAGNPHVSVRPRD